MLAWSSKLISMCWSCFPLWSYYCQMRPRPMGQGPSPFWLKCAWRARVGCVFPARLVRSVLLSHELQNFKPVWLAYIHGEVQHSSLVEECSHVIGPKSVTNTTMVCHIWVPRTWCFTGEREVLEEMVDSWIPWKARTPHCFLYMLRFCQRSHDLPPHDSHLSMFLWVRFLD